MMRLGCALLMGVTLWLGGVIGAGAREAVPMAQDPAIEARVMDLSKVLRCLVCQNQNLADSHADLAKDLRREIREMMEQDQSDRAIVDFLVARYGDFILYRPPFKLTTVLLWVGPLLLLGGGATVLMRTLRRRLRQQDPGTLSATEQRRASALLKGDDNGS